MYDVPRQRGRRAVVTGANSGIGKEIARRLSGAGGEVIMAVRSLERGENAREEILARQPDAQLEVRRLDLSDLTSVRRFSDDLACEGRGLDLLVNNAGLMSPPTRRVSADGFELQFATNFLGPFALTVELLPVLLATSGARVATMSSAAAAFGRLNFGDLQYEGHYRPFFAYAQSKLADSLLATSLATLASERHWDLVSAAAHPGFTRTNLFRAGANLGRHTPSKSWLSEVKLLPAQGVEQGAEPLLYAATSPDVITGAYYGPDGLGGLVGSTTLARPPRRARNPNVARRLWRVAEQLTGVTVPPP